MLEKLTEGIRERSLAREGEALVSKWEQTGLLEGLDSDIGRNNMSRLLENQAAELLREFNSVSTGGAANTASGDLRGFDACGYANIDRSHTLPLKRYCDLNRDVRLGHLFLMH